MSAADVTVPELTDPELISRVREGDVAAYGTLFSRHVDAATRLARLLVGGSDADDLVSEAFVKVLNVLLAGGGPDVAFRAYLLTSVRRLHIDKVRGAQRLTTTDDLTPFDPGVPFTDTAVAGFEGGAAARAFASLPERWQMVLWHLEVENQKPADIAPLLGMTANSVSALAYRAREGLRQAFLNMHSGDLVSDDCRETNDLMGGYVRGALSRRDTAKVAQHLEHCRRCAAVYLELSEVNSSLAAVLGPALLGSVGLAYLGAGSTSAGFGAGALALLGRGKDAAFAHLSATTATVAVAGMVAITTIAVVSRGPQQESSSAEPPVPRVTAPLTPPSSRAQPSTSPRPHVHRSGHPGGATSSHGQTSPIPAPAAALTLTTASPAPIQQATPPGIPPGTQTGGQTGAQTGGQGQPTPAPAPAPPPIPQPAPQPPPTPQPQPQPQPQPKPKPKPAPRPHSHHGQSRGHQEGHGNPARGKDTSPGGGHGGRHGGGHH